MTLDNSKKITLLNKSYIVVTEKIFLPNVTRYSFVKTMKFVVLNKVVVVAQME